jgi:hypothetical protein
MSSPNPVRTFTAEVRTSGSRVVIPLPFDPNAAWGQKARHHVTGSINGHAYRGPLVSDGEGYAIALGPAYRRDTDIEAGARVEVTLQPEGPQQATLAPDIAAALAAEPEAQAFFEGLATFYRKGYLRWVDGARRPEARAARIAEMVGLLKAGRKQR